MSYITGDKKFDREIEKGVGKICLFFFGIGLLFIGLIALYCHYFKK